MTHFATTPSSSSLTSAPRSSLKVPGTREPCIQIRSLSKVFGPDPASILPLIGQAVSKQEILQQHGHVVAVRDVNLTIAQGEIFVIMGLSGSGKSTLLRHLNRLVEPTVGDIIVEDRHVMDLDAAALRDLRRRCMAMVFQHFGLMPHHTVLQNVMLGLETQGVGKTERQAEAARWLELVGLQGYERCYPAQLSGGQRQRVGLARALCTNADILLMDEAFSALDPLIRNDMQAQLLSLQQALQKTIVFITHDLDEALRLGDRIAIMRDGEIEQVGRPHDIILRPASDYVAAFSREVNRARALTVGQLLEVNSVPATASGEHPDASVSDDLDDAAGGSATHGNTNTATLSSDETLEQALPRILAARQALPVVDAQGQIQGTLSPQAVSAILTAS